MDTRYPRHKKVKHPKADSRHRKKYRRHKHNPCPHAPRQLDAATELVGAFYKHPGRKRHNRWTAKLRWTEVNVDSDGFPLIVLRYAVEVELSADGSNWFLASRHQVSAKDDFDIGTKDHLIIHHIHGNLAYRFRVRAVSRECKATWSDYYVIGVPNDGPPAPSDVKIFRASHGIKLHWRVDEDPVDDELFTEDVAFFLGELWTNPDFGPVKAFTAEESDDKFTVTSHGFSNGDPVMLSRVPTDPYPDVTPNPFPGGFRIWHLYYVDNVTTHTFKLNREEDGSPINVTSDGEGLVHWGLVRKTRHLHVHRHLFKLDTEDFDEDTRFYGRVRSVSDHRSKSAWIPATAPVGNDDPDATPTGRRPAWHRHVFTFSFIDPLGVGLYKRPTRADDDYKIRRVTASFHTASTGDDTKFDIKINGSTFVFDEDFTKMTTVADGARDGSSKQMVNDIIERGDHIRVKCEQLAPTAPTFGTIHVICDRLREGPTTDSGGGGGE